MTHFDRKNYNFTLQSGIQVRMGKVYGPFFQYNTVYQAVIKDVASVE